MKFSSLLKLRLNSSRCLGRLLMLGGLLITAHVFAEDQFEPKAYLERVVDAVETQNFTGIFNYRRSGYKIEQYIYQQITEDGKVKEWIKQSAKDEGFALVNRKVVCVTKGYKNKFRANTILQSLTKNDIDDLLRDYKITLSPHTIKVGNRIAKELVFTAKDGYRYTYKMAIDEATLFPLSYTFLGSQNNVLESGQFSHFDPVANNDIVIKPFAGCMKIKSKSSVVSESGWLVQWKPVGFDLDRIVRKKQTQTEQLVYSDGLVYFSVFIESLSDPRMSEIDRHFGATVVVSRKIDLLEHGKYLVTVVGELPFSTAERIALSVWKKPSAE